MYTPFSLGLYFAKKITTPLLILHNDKDGAVDWTQGIEYYNTVRRLQKPVVMLQYKGENHGLWEPANQKDYTVRMKEFFDHYLKGIENGWKDTPRVRLEVRETLDEYAVRNENEFPLARTEYKKLYLNAQDGSLNPQSPKKGKVVVKVDAKMKSVRPYTVCAVARNLKIDKDVLSQMIQLQEKVATTFGRNRKEVAIGYYDLDKIKPPIRFTTIKPDGIKFNSS
jgi:predicted acyl esterase